MIQHLGMLCLRRWKRTGANLQGTGQITPTAHFANDLGLDSLDTVEVVMAIEEVRDDGVRVGP